MISRKILEKRARKVAATLTKRQAAIDFFSTLIEEAIKGKISSEDAAWGIAWLMPHPVVLYDDQLNDIATLAAQFEVPDHNLGALDDREESFNLLCSLIDSVQEEGEGP